MKLKNFIFGSSAIVAVVFFFSCYILVQHVFERTIRSNAVQTSNTLAKVTFASMYELMSTGWTHQQAESFIQATSSAAKDSSGVIQIYRGPIVAEIYGEIKQPHFDEAIQSAIQHNKPLVLAAPSLLEDFFDSREKITTHVNPGEVRYVFPLSAEEKCLKCHVNAKTGDVLGVIDVRQNIQTAIDASRKEMGQSLLALSVLALLGAFFVVRLVSRRIDHSISTIESSVEQINQIDDLSHLQLAKRDAGFIEFQRIFSSIQDLSQKLHDTAVDKDILKFEISLLEKFVITSDVVRDWREYICQLLEDINQILEAHVMFSIFKIDEELFDLELFWRIQPSPSTLNMMEAHIRQALRSHTRFGDLATVNIHHNVANKKENNLLELTENDVRLRVKSFFVDTPMIGGIVGIGVHADVPVDETRHLVMDSVLSTLLNVIGSVKAIYKYTRDLEYYATRDPLTDLYNQRVFWEMLGYETIRAHKHQYHFGLLLLDLDNFKTVNDGYGHHIGDQYLQEFAKTVQKALRNDDVFSRYGGDEFVIILPESNFQETTEAAKRILQTVEQMSISAPDGSIIKGTTSIGMAVYPEHAKEPKDLFLFADNLMYKAKSEGKDRVSIPSEQDVMEAFRDISQRSVQVLNAIEEKQVIPYFQPILDVKTGEIAAYECLSRLEIDGQILRADQFIEIAEKMGVIHRMDMIVIERALTEIKDHHFDGYIFFNLSPRSLVLNEFAHSVQQIVKNSGIPPERIVFEITERDSVRNMSLLESFLSDLKSAGFKLALDDFGSGFSSFHYLRRFPVDILKLEGDFIMNILRDPRDHVFVRNMNDLAHQLGIKVVAEFVEDQEVLDELAKIGIDLAQGYHIGRPSPHLGDETSWKKPH